MLIVGTTTNLEDVDRSFSLAEDAYVTAVAVGSTGPPTPGADGPVYALLDGERIDRVDELDVVPVLRLPTKDAQSIAATNTGDLLVGTAGGHLTLVSPENGTAQPVAAFDTVPGRDGWHNPADEQVQLRSLAVASDGGWLANVHVGGLWRSADNGASWVSVIAAEADVHEVVTGPNGRAAVASAQGFGWSLDGGQTWAFTASGLHAPYARAVALDGEVAFVTASTGPDTADGRLYRCELGGDLKPVAGGLPESFPFNLDTGCIAARDGQVALGTRDGAVYRSNDSGATWERIVEEMRPIRVVRFV